jgi:putative membrane protein
MPTLLRSIQRFHSSPTIRKLFVRMAWFGLYTAVVTMLQLNVMRLNISIDTIFLSLLGTLLSLLLVFRTNTAYDRFWEGRKLWGGLVNNARSFAMTIQAMLPPEDQANRKFFARYLSAFAFALKGHLRDDMRFAELEGISKHDMSYLQTVVHIPNALATMILCRIDELHREGAIDRQYVIISKPHHTAFVETIGACERIKRTPIPHSYNFYIKLFISIYVGILPFMLIDKYGYYTIFAVMMAAYALMGIEMIASEIEEPFGLDANDLPLDQMALTIKMNVHEILGVEMPVSDAVLTMNQ